jgi:hypothetical protein
MGTNEMGSCRVFTQPYPVTECNGPRIFAVDASDIKGALSERFASHSVLYK